MTIARRRGAPLDVGVAVAVAPVTPVAPEVLPTPPPAGVPLPLPDAPGSNAPTPVGRLRRCTFRRINRVDALPQRPQAATYEVMCLYYADGEEPLALGDVESARPICDSCSAAGIFRPDEA